MGRSIFGGATDYSHQSFDDMTEDLRGDLCAIDESLVLVAKHRRIAEEDNYWKNNVPFNFQAYVEYCLKYYATARIEIADILSEITAEVQSNHCVRLKHLGKTAREINHDIGREWNSDDMDRKKDYGNKSFDSVDQIYAILRDLAVSLQDVWNLADRLEHFVGRKPQSQLPDKISILFLSASPPDQIPLRVDKEIRIIDEQIRAARMRDNIQLIKKSAIKPDTMTQAMLDVSPAIVQFSGHGSNDGICVEDDAGNSIEFPISGIEKMFSLFKDKLKSVILNSCYSEPQAKAISMLGIYVIGMNDSIGDDAAIAFSTGFYQAIGANKDIPFAFEMGRVLMATGGSENIPALWHQGVKLK